MPSAIRFNLDQSKILSPGKGLNVTQSIKFVFHKVEKNYWKEKKRWLPPFSLLFNPFPNKPWFLPVWSTILLKTLWEKEKLLVTSNFSFSQCFLAVWITFCHFQQNKNCHLQTLSVWKSQKFAVWEKVKQCFQKAL